MKSRKWSVLALATFTAALLLTGFTAFADDEEETSELHKIMEKVQIQNATILKGVRNAVYFRKSHDDVKKAADELAKLGKQAKEREEDALANAKDVEEPEKKWGELMDAFLGKLDDFKRIVDKEDADQKEAKSAYREVSRSCTGCHNVFRIEEEDF